MLANNMNPDQTAKEQSDLCPYYLQYMLQKNGAGWSTMS